MTDMRIVVEVPPDVAAMLATGMQYEVSGLNTTYPVLAVDGKRLEGEFIDLIGTDLIFDHTAAARTPPPDDAGFVAASVKRLVFKHPVVKKQPSKRASGPKNPSIRPKPTTAKPAEAQAGIGPATLDGAVEKSAGSARTSPAGAAEKPGDSARTSPAAAVEKPGDSARTSPVGAVEKPRDSTRTSPAGAVEKPRDSARTSPARKSSGAAVDDSTQPEDTSTVPGGFSESVFPFLRRPRSEGREGTVPVPTGDEEERGGGTSDLSPSGKQPKSPS